MPSKIDYIKQSSQYLIYEKIRYFYGSTRSHVFHLQLLFILLWRKKFDVHDFRIAPCHFPHPLGSRQDFPPGADSPQIS